MIARLKAILHSVHWPSFWRGFKDGFSLGPLYRFLFNRQEQEQDSRKELRKHIWEGRK